MGQRKEDVRDYSFRSQLAGPPVFPAGTNRAIDSQVRRVPRWRPSLGATNKWACESETAELISFLKPVAVSAAAGFTCRHWVGRRPP
jgi:hypothetical protein